MNNLMFRRLTRVPVAVFIAGLLSLIVTPAQAATQTLPAGETMYAISCDSKPSFKLYKVNIDNGDLTLVGNGTAGDDELGCPSQAAYDAASGKAYFASTFGKLYSMDLTTGLSTEVNTLSGDTHGGGPHIAIDKNGSSRYTWDCDKGSINLGTATASKAANNLQNCTDGFYYWAGLAYNASNDKFYTVNDDNTEDDITPHSNNLYTVPADGNVDTTGGVALTGEYVDVEAEYYRSMAIASDGSAWILKHGHNFEVSVLSTLDLENGNVVSVADLEDGGISIKVGTIFIVSDKAKTPDPKTDTDSGSLADTGASGNLQLAIAAILLIFAGALVVRRATSRN
jgi:hypothetical protein